MARIILKTIKDRTHKNNNTTKISSGKGSKKRIAVRKKK